jgi:Flp pilus assembly protein TadG
VRDLISGLARPLLRLLGRDERGAVGVLIGLLFGGGVLLGMAALAIDVGELYWERAQLQNGADAAALAVAKSCATGTCDPSVAATYADANAKDGLAGANLVCGSGTLGGCPASTGLLTDCPSAPAPTTNYAEVHTSTKTATGTVVPPVFGSTLLGNGNYTGTTVLACAQAEWGGPVAAQVIPFAISACTWDQATGLGTTYAAPPPAVPSASDDQVITLRSGSGDGCSTEPSGSDGAGNFGWTADDGSCSLAISSATFAGKPGASVPGDCKSVLAADQAGRTVVYLAVYTTCSGNGANAVYTLKGFAAFVITGFQLPGLSAPDWLNPANSCDNKCIEGYFTQGIIPSTSSLGGAYLGAAIIRLSG